MKKALIVLLILAVAGGLFAQSWSGSVTTGALIDFGKNDADETPIPVSADDDDGHAVKAGLSFTNSGEDWGITVSANANVGGDNSVNGLSIGDMKGWVKFADMFKLTAGKGIGGAWGSGGNTDTEIGAGNAAVRLEVEPFDGLNFGVRFGYPTDKVSADKIANFFQETGIGAKYSADVWWVALGLDLDSPESTAVAEVPADPDDPDSVATPAVEGKLDALFYLGFNFSGLSLFNIHVGTKVENLFTDKTVTVFEKLDGSVGDLNWYVQADEKLIPDPLAVGLEAGLSYGIEISDKANAEIGAKANASYAKEFSFDEWDIYAKLSYNFNDNVSTFVKLDVDGLVDPSKITPTLKWNIKFSF